MTITTLETPRLLIRPFTVNDYSACFSYLSDPEIALFEAWEPYTTIERAKSFVFSIINNYDKETPDSLEWLIAKKVDHTVIGNCGFQIINYRHKYAEIGFIMSKQFWNKGFSTEAITALLEYGFQELQLHRIEARCHEQNFGSQRVLEKNGFTYEGTMRQRYLSKDVYADIKLYGILK